MSGDNILLRWTIDLADQSARLGDIVVSFADEVSGTFTATVEGAGEINFRRKLNLLWQASEEFENELFRSKHGG